MEKKICLEPSCLDNNLHRHLSEKIKSEIVGYCDQKYGYITKIYDKLEIIENTISATSLGVFFQVKFQAKVFKPVLNAEYNGNVCMVFQQGVFVEVFEKMKVLIPADKMEGYKFDKTNSTFRKGSKIISEGTNVKIQINMIKYEKQNFNCIGSLKIT